MTHHKLIIVGSGPAGYTAAIYSSRARLEPLMFQGSLQGGQLSTTTDVENFPGFPEGILGPELMIRMKEQAERFGTIMKQEEIVQVDLSKRPFKLASTESEYSCDSLIISTGASPIYLNIPGEKELLGYGVSTCATCDGAFFKNEIISVIGGGDSACEEAVYLSKFGKKVYLIHRRDELRASKIMQEKVKNTPSVEILWNKKVTHVLGDKKSGISTITLQDTVDNTTSSLETAAMFVAIGHTPNSKIFSNFIECNENGYIITGKGVATGTNIPGVFACGDVQDFSYRQAISAAGSGCCAAIDAERFLNH
jgi:thioredoxin reductase (NADPH)